MNEELFTYDDLYELLRTELSSKDLKPLKLEDLKKIKQYLDSKENLLCSSETSKFSKERHRIFEEIGNAKQVLNKLYQKRVKKIINRAIFTVRSESGAKDTSNMLKSEILLYNSLIKELKENEKLFFSEIDQMNLDLPEKKESKELKSIEKQEETKENCLKTIKILEEISELQGTDLKRYGPYKKGDIAELPRLLADIIIKQEKGQENENIEKTE